MTLDAIVKSVDQLVSLPDAVIRANELLDSPDSRIEAIGEVIAHDPALSARLLKLVNSAFYNFPAQVDTISRAITLIGLDELRSIILATSTAQTFKNLSPESIDMDSFWHRSVYCGLVAKKLSALLEEDFGESIFLTGLMHNLGTLILFAFLPNQARVIVQTAETTRRPLHEVETEVLGYSTASLGARLLENWQLPAKLWQPIQFQHAPEKAERFQTETQLLNLAMQITDSVEPELKSSEPIQLEALQPPEIEGILLTPEQLDMLATDANIEAFDVLAIINPNATIIF